MQVISLEDVCKTYFMGDNQVHALRNVSFSIEEGEFVSIMGPSGSGKSTCMNMIGCLDRPTSGKVFISGKSKTTDEWVYVYYNSFGGWVNKKYLVK